MATRLFLSAVLPLMAGALSVTPSAPLTATAGVDVPASCPVTVYPDPAFIPPAPYPATPPRGGVWIGSERLWVMAHRDGVWRGTGRDTPNGPVYRNKQFWWRPGYHGPSEPVPELHVTGRRLDRDTAPIVAGPATNAHHRDFGGWAMLVMPEIPRGCWELTGTYADQRVTLVVWVGE